MINITFLRNWCLASRTSTFAIRSLNRSRLIYITSLFHPLPGQLQTKCIRRKDALVPTKWTWLMGSKHHPNPQPHGLASNSLGVRKSAIFWAAGGKTMKSQQKPCSDVESNERFMEMLRLLLLQGVEEHGKGISRLAQKNVRKQRGIQPKGASVRPRNSSKGQCPNMSMLPISSTRNQPTMGQNLTARRQNEQKSQLECRVFLSQMPTKTLCFYCFFLF